MAYSTLRSFVEALESSGELSRVKAKVSPRLEASEIVDRLSKSAAARPSEHAPSFDPKHHDLGGHAVLFEAVEGASSKAPLLMNAFGSYRRMEMALGCEAGGFESLAERVEALVKPEPPTGLMEKVRKGLELAKVASFAPKVVRSGRCQQVVERDEQIDLLSLPIIKCWPSDGDPVTCGYPITSEQAGTAQGEGRYITFAGVYTIHPDDAGKSEGSPRPSRNVGMYRAQLIDGRRTAMHWHMHHDGARHWRAWKKRGEPMPLAIVFGGESVLPYAATAPLPPGVSELLFAGFLNDGSIPLVGCKTVDLHVPANAELVIEGHVRTDCDPPGLAHEDLKAGRWKPEKGCVLEGPFGDHTGYYSLPDRYPIFEVSAVTRCREPIFPATIVGLPPQEDYYMGKATERLFRPLLKTLVPDVLDYSLPMFGAFHNCAFLQIRKEYPLQARRVMHAIWGAGQMAWTKMLVLVDETVDVHDHEQVLFHLCANCDPARDVEMVNGPLDILDHAAPRLGSGSKIGFDATAKIHGEQVNGHPIRDWPAVIEMSRQVKEQVTRRWSEYGL